MTTKIVLLTVLALVFGLSITTVEAQTTHQFTLKASHGWINTHITLTAGEAVTISSAGNWSWNGGTTYVGPDGDPTDDYNAFDLFEPFDFFSQARLIGFIGNTPAQNHFGDGSFFPQTSGYISIGSGQTFTAPYDGSLWLIFNDSAVTGTSEPNDNLGSSVITVTTGGADAAGPEITITAPSGGYAQNQAVTAQYSCDDPGDTVMSCAGPVTSGSALDTAVAGHHAFTVVATDANGNTTSRTVGYEVVDTTKAALVPTGLAFEPTYIGSHSVIKPVLLYNPQTTAISITDMHVSFGPFQITGTTCGATLQPHHNCKVSVAYFPTFAGSERGELDVTTSLSTDPVPLWGVGTQVRITPATLSFGDQQVSTTSAPQTLLFRNSQRHYFTASQIVVTGDFALDPSTTCPVHGGKVLKGSTCNIVVTFTPTATGTRNGTVLVHGGTNVDPVTVPLSGNGTP